jgi:phosphomannomutase
MIKPQIFKANDIRGVTTEPDSEWDVDGAFAIGAALVDTLDLVSAEGSLVLGRDMRLSSPEYSASFARGVLSRGADVIDIGLASTDELWFASGRLGLPGAMFTASHSPGRYNGIKFCLAAAKPVPPAMLREVADRALDSEPVPASAPGELTSMDLLHAYADHLHSLVGLSGIRRLRVVADSGNGMAGHTLPAVLGVADLELIGLFLELDGSFPNHPPNPLEPENLLEAQAAVLQHGADLALVFDGDADRCCILDELGHQVSPAAITAMIANQVLQAEPGGGHSGHYYFRDFWGADSGMLAALHVLSLLGSGRSTMSELVARYSRPNVEATDTATMVALRDETLDLIRTANSSTPGGPHGR